MARLAFGGYLRVLKDNGDVCTDATATWYLKGTTTLTDTYTTSALSIANANPVAASALGIFPDMWLDDDIAYKVVIAGTGVTTKTIDGTELGQDVTSAAGPTANVSDFRVSLTSATPVTTSDVTAAATIYLTPYCGNKISIYDGTTWTKYHADELSTNLSAGTHPTNGYDLYVFLLGGVVTLGTVPWLSATGRGSGAALNRIDGVLVNNLDVTVRYGTGSSDTVTLAAGKGTLVGSFYASSGQTEDSMANRDVWNLYNRRARPMAVYETADSWAYTTATVRAMNNNTANRLRFMRGLNEDAMSARATLIASNSSAGVVIAGGIGLDSTSAIATNSIKGSVQTPVANYRVNFISEYDDFPGLGLHYLQALEYSTASGTTTWLGDGGAPTLIQAGITGVAFA